MMTDLLAIFVILFSFAMMNSKQITRASTQSTNNATTASQTQNVMPVYDRFNSFVETVNNHIVENGLTQQLSVSNQGDGVILLRVADSALFESGRADLDDKAKKLLGSISKILTADADSIKMVRIEGHTDNRPINNRQFKNNWSLSTSRAVSVLERLSVLSKSKLGPEKFSAVGYGEFHPIANNDTAAGRTKNRRVDFIIETATSD